MLQVCFLLVYLMYFFYPCQQTNLGKSFNAVRHSAV